MATLTAWKFASAKGADSALATIQDLERRELIEVLDAVEVRWGEDAAKPETEPETHRLRPEPNSTTKRAWKADDETPAQFWTRACCAGVGLRRGGCRARFGARFRVVDRGDADSQRLHTQ